MAIIGIILKIIGIVLLVLLGILITLLIIVLFFPIQYQVSIAKYEALDIEVDVRVFYFFRAHYDTQLKVVSIKLFCITIKRLPLEEASALQEDTEDVNEAREQDDHVVSVVEKAGKQAEYVNQIKEVDSSLTKAHTVDSKKEESILSSSDALNKKASQKEEKARKKQQKKEAKKEKTDWASVIKELWTNPERKPFIKETTTLIKELVKYLVPSVEYFHLLIGRESPNETGELMAALGILYPWIGKYGEVEGNYNEAGLWGRIKFKSNIRLAKILQIVLAFILKKSVRNYIKTLLSIGKVEKNGI